MNNIAAELLGNCPVCEHPVEIPYEPGKPDDEPIINCECCGQHLHTEELRDRAKRVDSSGRPIVSVGAKPYEVSPTPTLWTIGIAGTQRAEFFATAGILLFANRELAEFQMNGHEGWEVIEVTEEVLRDYVDRVRRGGRADAA